MPFKTSRDLNSKIKVASVPNDLRKNSRQIFWERNTYLPHLEQINKFFGGGGKFCQIDHLNIFSTISSIKLCSSNSVAGIRRQSTLTLSEYNPRKKAL